MATKFQKLTRNAVRALAVGARLTEHGISVVRNANGDTTYSVNAMIDGARIHRVVGRESDGVTREQAERAIEALRTRAREDRLNLPSRRKTHMTFEQAAKSYVERLEGSGGKNIAVKRRQLSQHLVPALGPSRLDRLTEFGLRRYRVARSLAGAKDATINREMATVSHMLRSAVVWKWIARDALPVVPMAAEPRKPTAILSAEQEAALMTAALADQDKRLWLFIAFGLNTAMRHREILAVRYDQVDFDSRRIFIPHAKAGEREQPITSVLTAMLAKQQKVEANSTGYVFPIVNEQRAHGPHRSNMARPFLRAVIRAGLDPKKVTPHTMRHTAITRLVQAGVDLPTIQRISGHKTLAMVLRYTHVHGSHIDAAISVLENRR